MFCRSCSILENIKINGIIEKKKKKNGEIEEGCITQSNSFNDNFASLQYYIIFNSFLLTFQVNFN